MGRSHGVDASPLASASLCSHFGLCSLTPIPNPLVILCWSTPGEVCQFCFPSLGFFPCFIPSFDRTHSNAVRWLDGIMDSMDVEFEQTLGGGERQGSLACCGPWGGNEPDMTQQRSSDSSEGCRCLSGPSSSCLDLYSRPLHDVLAACLLVYMCLPSRRGLHGAGCLKV